MKTRTMLYVLASVLMLLLVACSTGKVYDEDIEIEYVKITWLDGDSTIYKNVWRASQFNGFENYTKIWLYDGSIKRFEASTYREAEINILYSWEKESN